MVKLTKNIRQAPALFLLAIMLAVGIFHNSQTLSEAREVAPVVIPSVTVDNTKVTLSDQSVSVASTVVAEPSEVAQPSVQGLRISAINLNIPLGKTTLGANRELLVPADASRAAWYKLGPKPGEAGSALITGHYDSSAGPGVFYNLKQLQAGNLIEVKRDDGKIATYKVEKLESYAQDRTFPWNLVYKTSGESTLRIITCDGVYNPKTGRYSRNLVVYASLVSVS